MLAISFVSDLLFPMSTSDVYCTVEEVVYDWESLGRNLGIPHSTLKAIDKDHLKVKAKMIELIQTWMTGGNMPTWSLLAEALCKPSTDHPRLAEKISQQQSKLKLNLCIHLVYSKSVLSEKS